MKPRLLVVEDDLALRTGLRDSFATEGYEVTTAADGQQAWELLSRERFDLLLLDVMLPLRGGLEILRQLRESGRETPVLLLTARSDEHDKVLGLDLGADDYVTKPFSLRELSARVKALLRRGVRPASGEEAWTEEPFHVGEAEVDLARFEVHGKGTTCSLSPKEAAMLALLRAAEGRVVSRREFLEKVWGGDVMVGNRTIDTHVLNLRQKLEPDPRRPRHLLTVHGVGYRLVLTS